MSLAFKWALILSLSMILLGMGVVYGIGFFSPRVTQLPPFGPKPRSNGPPANATVLPPPPSLLFSFSLSKSKVTVSRGESTDITVTIRGNADVNVSLAVEMAGPSTAPLPAGVGFVFEKNMLTVPTNSTVTVNLRVSVQDEATPGEYKLDVVGTQRPAGWVLSMGLPLELIVS